MSYLGHHKHSPASRLQWAFEHAPIASERNLRIIYPQSPPVPVPVLWMLMYPGTKPAYLTAVLKNGSRKKTAQLGLFVTPAESLHLWFSPISMPQLTSPPPPVIDDANLSTGTLVAYMRHFPNMTAFAVRTKRYLDGVQQLEREYGSAEAIPEEKLRQWGVTVRKSLSSRFSSWRRRRYEGRKEYTSRKSRARSRETSVERVEGAEGETDAAASDMEIETESTEQFDSESAKSVAESDQAVRKPYLPNPQSVIDPDFNMAFLSSTATSEPNKAAPAHLSRTESLSSKTSASSQEVHRSDIYDLLN
ncbi:hypothetical protein BDZ91DRAFT_768267 [Kalaharituber pfeilii]|nr:hypothetical protein BDZ91DRAFT_768267 [Kalaharituber pfeilii]